LSAPWWTQRRIRHLQEMAGTTGKQPGEPQIISMGSTGPPHIENPHFVRDRLISDGAQVTRPSIDPYREPVETYVYLSGGRIRLSMPVVVKTDPDADPVFLSAVVKACYCMNILAHVGPNFPGRLHEYAEAVVADIKLMGLARFAALTAGAGELVQSPDPVFVRAPPSEEYDWIPEALEAGIDGIWLDEDLDGNVAVEVAVSLLDRELRKRGARNKVGIVAGGSTIRGSDDIHKLVLLGADAVEISKAVMVAVGLGGQRPEERQLQERVENLLLGIQRELKLLAGAAGVSNIFNTLVGNRELLRAVELDRETRIKLGVKQAGVG
jgi:hypothetical protein